MKWNDKWMNKSVMYDNDDDDDDGYNTIRSNNNNSKIMWLFKVTEKMLSIVPFVQYIFSFFSGHYYSVTIPVYFSRPTHDDDDDDENGKIWI